MVYVYYLETKVVDGAEAPLGIEFIHDAILDVEDGLHKLIQDTTDDEHRELTKVAKFWREAKEEEVAALNKMKAERPVTPPPRDLASEIDALRADLDLKYRELNERLNQLTPRSLPP